MEDFFFAHCLLRGSVEDIFFRGMGNVPKARKGRKHAPPEFSAGASVEDFFFRGHCHGNRWKTFFFARAATGIGGRLFFSRALPQKSVEDFFFGF